MKPLIFGCAGPALSDPEREFFAREQPAGFILFARNVQSPQQLKTLTTDLQLCVERSDILMLIDQEGGRVQRMGPPHWRKYPPMAIFGQAAEINYELAVEALRLNCLLLADDLRRVGINVDCLPLLDVPAGDADNVIGDRAFASRPDIVGRLGRVVTDSLQEAGVLPVVKHLPGHGRAKVDSHKVLPRVDASLELLTATDFAPFKALADCPLGMTAHIVYEGIDEALPATLSKTVIRDVIRRDIGFDGLLMTDDLSMQALSGTMAERAEGALEAGCDLVLHCNGKMDEMLQAANALQPSNGHLVSRLTDAVDVVRRTNPIDRMNVEAQYDSVMLELNSII